MNNRIGEKNINSFGSEIEIIGYRKAVDIDVYFPKYDWTFKHAQYYNFKTGNIKCPYEKRVYNNGYIGEGKYPVSINNKNTFQYKTWNHMLERCYSEKYKNKYPTYKNCTVSEPWLNFQNYASWHDDNYYEVEGERTELDKDILIKGNKIYSSDTCIFVPRAINSLIIKSDKMRGNYPIGITYRNNKYIARCNVNGNRIFLGTYKTLEEAFKTYKQYKENLIKEIANKYKNQIPDKLYRALLNYEVEITD